MVLASTSLGRFVLVLFGTSNFIIVVQYLAAFLLYFICHYQYNKTVDENSTIKVTYVINVNACQLITLCSSKPSYARILVNYVIKR